MGPFVRPAWRAPAAVLCCARPRAPCALPMPRVSLSRMNGKWTEVKKCTRWVICARPVVNEPPAVFPFFSISLFLLLLNLPHAFPSSHCIPAIAILPPFLISLLPSYPPASAAGEPQRCADGSHEWKQGKRMVCRFCGECSELGVACYRSSNKGRAQRGEPCGCGSGDAGCAKCGICKRCDGLPREKLSFKLSPVPGLADDAVVLQAVCGLAHSVFLLADGSVYTMGGNEAGQVKTIRREELRRHVEEDYYVYI